MLTGCTQAFNSGRERILEIAVPVIAFGVTLTGILLWSAGLKIDFQYFAAGCVISSFLMAYLAWIRPRKDIVALSTPVYAIVFFVAPVDSVSGAVLQLLYAVSLTILLIRLKYRFGSVIAPSGSLNPAEPLGEYMQHLKKELPSVPAPTSLRAGLIFTRFAQGEYDQARELALLPEDVGIVTLPVLSRAFSVVAEQAGQIAAGNAAPGEYTRFLPEQVPFLFHPMDPNTGREYSLTLDNALILLYIVAFREKEVELTPLLPFARKLCGD